MTDFYNDITRDLTPLGKKVLGPFMFLLFVVVMIIMIPMVLPLIIIMYILNPLIDFTIKHTGIVKFYHLFIRKD